MSRARERRNLDLEEETKENEATLSQEDSTDIEGEEASMQRGKTSGGGRVRKQIERQESSGLTCSAVPKLAQL